MCDMALRLPADPGVVTRDEGTRSLCEGGQREDSAADDVAGVFFSSHYVPLPDTYEEVHP